MKIVNVREARGGLAGLIDQAQKEPICLTRHGKAVVVVKGVEGIDLSSVIIENSKEFWDEIDRRRRSKARMYTIEEVRQHFGLKPMSARGRKSR
jgi:prevent-host-death family protein